VAAIARIAICAHDLMFVLTGSERARRSPLCVFWFRHTIFYLSVYSDSVRHLRELSFLPHQQNVKTTPGPPRGVMVPLVLLVHPDPPWSTFSVNFQKVWIRADRCGPGGPRGPQPPLVDQERSGPPWTTLRHFPNT